MTFLSHVEAKGREERREKGEGGKKGKCYG